MNGGPSITQRPMKDLLMALNIQDKIDFDNDVDHLPFTINSDGTFKGGRIEINSQISSQFISSLLMVAPFAQESVELVLTDVEDDG